MVNVNIKHWSVCSGIWMQVPISIPLLSAEVELQKEIEICTYTYILCSLLQAVEQTLCLMFLTYRWAFNGQHTSWQSPIPISFHTTVRQCMGVFLKHTTSSQSLLPVHGKYDLAALDHHPYIESLYRLSDMNWVTWFMKFIPLSVLLCLIMQMI